MTLPLTYWKLLFRRLGTTPIPLAALVGSALVLFITGCSSRSDANHLLRGLQAQAATFTQDPGRMTDGVIAPAGTRFDSVLSSRIDHGCGVQWDLGQVKPIRRVWLQADNDDSYALLLSEDGKSWASAWEAPAVAAVGLQARSTKTLDAVARYIRLEPRGGDGTYSVAELDISSLAEGAWPDALKQQDGSAQDVPGRPSLDRPVRLATALAMLVFFGPLLVGWLRRKRGLSPLTTAGAESPLISTDTLRQPLFWIAVLLSVFVIDTALDYMVMHRFNLVDDAYISLQYAKNWASGQGLVFNPGERVEGYSNFLWVVLLTPLWPLSGHDPVWMTRASTWLALGLALVGLWLLAVIGRRLFPRVWLPTAMAVLLLTFDDTYLSYIAVFALENHLLVVVMLAGLALSVYRPRHWELGLGVSFALVAMTRLDGLLWAATFFFVYALPLVIHRAQSAEAGVQFSWRSLLRIAVGLGSLFVPYFLWRSWYFDDLLPNTFYLKTGTTLGGVERGLEYVHGYLAQRYYVPVLALLAVFQLRSLWVRWLLLFALLHVAYIIQVGGDFYAGHRFLFAVTPVLALLVASVVDHAIHSVTFLTAPRLGVIVMVLCVLVRGGTMRDGPYTVDLHNRTTSVDHNVQFMQWMKGAARPGSSMVVGDIGATGFFSDIRVLDVFGVVDRVVAHKHVPTFGTGHAGHEKRMTREEQLAADATYIKWGYVGDFDSPPGYYIFNDVPLHLHIEGLWVKDDLAKGRVLPGHRFKMTPAEIARWTKSGSAFVNGPVTRAAQNQRALLGHQGHLINSYTTREGDRARGRLLSPPFELVGDRMRLLVGGGRDPERLRVSMLVADERVFSETGTSWETLGRREWDITALRGKMAQIEIVDDAIGAWGHILVDEIEQWVGTPNISGKL